MGMCRNYGALNYSAATENYMSPSLQQQQQQQQQELLLENLKNLDSTDSSAYFNPGINS